MGALDVYVVETNEQLKQFVTAILKDMKALNLMLERDMFDRGTMRIGAEQEFCLVDKHLKPAMIALEFLEWVDDTHFTPALATINLEINLAPLEFTGAATRRMENQLYGLLQKVDQLANDFGARVLLTGLLPTI